MPQQKNPICPRCKERPKTRYSGYCKECRNALARERYRREQAQWGLTVYGKDEKLAEGIVVPEREPAEAYVPERVEPPVEPSIWDTVDLSMFKTAKEGPEPPSDQLQ